MGYLWRTVLGLPIVLPALAHGAEQNLTVELNSTENSDRGCRLTFLIENKRNTAIDSIKLDLAVFDGDGIIHRRMAVELGPVRAEKTNVRTFLVEGKCEQIGSVLVNDITACTPGDPGSCLDELSLSSRVKNVRFYK
jgi:hypothetical protein